MESKNELLNSPWVGIKFDDDEIEFLTSDIPLTDLVSGETLISMHEYNTNVFIVNSGKVHVSVDDKEGQRKTALIATKGGVVGEISAILQKHSYITAEAIEDSQVYALDCSYFLNKLTQDSSLNSKLIKELALKNHVLISQVAMLAFDKPITRVENALKWIFSEYGNRKRDGIYLNYRKKAIKKITHQNIADITGLSRVSVSKAFSELYKSGVLVKLENGLKLGKNL